MKRALIALTLVLGLSVVSTSHLAGSIESLATGPVDDAAIQKWKLEAQQYDAAIKEIDGILRLNLTTKEGSDAAEKILEKNISKLHFAKAKIASGSLRFASFRTAIEEEAAKHGGNEKFAEGIRRDASLAKNIRGLQEVARGMDAEIQPSISVLKKVGEAFGQAAQKLNAGTSSKRHEITVAHHPVGRSEDIPSVLNSESFLAPGNACQNLGISVSSGICEIIIGVIIAHIAILGGNLSCINPCIDQKINQRSSCQSKARDKPWPFNIAAISQCKEQFLGGVAGCILGCD